MSELEADDEILGVAVTLLMGADQDLAQLSQVFLVLFDDEELMGVGACVGSDGHGFAAVDRFCAALAEALPASAHLRGGPAGAGGVPAFHRLAGPAIPGALA